MRIGIIGTGNMGGVLARLFAQRGHQVFIGSRDPAKAKAIAGDLPGQASGGSIREAAEHGEAVLLAVHHAAMPEALKAAGPLAGKILMDCTNPLTPDFMGLTVGYNSSGAEEIQAIVPQAKVVKIFNHNFSQALSQPRRGDVDSVAIYCGDDDAAKQKVAALAKELGFDPVDLGPLRHARYLEPLAELVIQLAYAQGHGNRISLGLLRA
jgi:8-hydroxy-5-deazaflavin:NADPH oxidoreductase